MSAIDAKKIAENLTAFLRMHNLSRILPDVIRHLQILEEQRKERELFVIRTAHAVSESIIEDIRAFMKVPVDVAVSVEEDPGLVGGFVARYGEKVYDASYANGLEVFKNTLLGH